MAHVACADCTENCLRLHQTNGNPPSKITRFLAVMFGKDHEKIMELPALFAPTLEKMARQVFHLKDADGDQWTVVLSRVEGTLAFTTGWSLFYKGHDLEEGSFLIFEYMEGSKSFFVRVFDRSGLEAVYEAADADMNDKSSPENAVQESDVKGVVVEMASPIEASTKSRRESDMFIPTLHEAMIVPSLPQAKMVPEEFVFGPAEKETNSDIGSVDEVIEIDDDSDLDAKPLDDAVNMEKASVFKANGSGVRTADHEDMNNRSETMEKIRYYQKASGLKMPIFFPGQTVRKDCGEPARKDIKTEKSSGFNVIAPKFGLKVKPKAEGRETEFDHFDRSVFKTSVKKLCKQTKGGNFNKMPDFCSTSKKCNNGKRSCKMQDSEWINEATVFTRMPRDLCHRRKRPARRIPEKANDVIKVETDSSDDDRQRVIPGSFSVVVESLEFQGLPPGIRSFWTHGHVIYLKDPNWREWPVVCQVKRSRKTLTANWGMFCRKNNINEGDTCRFDHHEDAKLKLYRVHVERRSS